jgi:hypothetical protein
MEDFKLRLAGVELYFDDLESGKRSFAFPRPFKTGLVLRF